MIEALGGVRKTAAALGVPPTTVQHWKDKGQAPSWRVGNLTSAYQAATVSDPEATVAHCTRCDEHVSAAEATTCSSEHCPMRVAEQLEAAA